jgi:hypothetical protein
VINFNFLISGSNLGIIQDKSRCGKKLFECSFHQQRTCNIYFACGEDADLALCVALRNMIEALLGSNEAKVFSYHLIPHMLLSSDDAIWEIAFLPSTALDVNIPTVNQS